MSLELNEEQTGDVCSNRIDLAVVGGDVLVAQVDFWGGGEGGKGNPGDGTAEQQTGFHRLMLLRERHLDNPTVAGFIINTKNGQAGARMLDDERMALV